MVARRVSNSCLDSNTFADKPHRGEGSNVDIDLSDPTNAEPVALHKS